MLDKLDKKQFNPQYSLESLPLDLNIPEWLMILLFAGVGVYMPHNKNISPAYSEYILTMAADGKLAFLVADDSIWFGANYPFSHVYIEEEIAKEHSIGAIFQLAGRAGRRGQSWTAKIYIGNNTSGRIMNYIRGTESLGVTEEAKNMVVAFNKVLSEMSTRKNAMDILQFKENIPVKPKPETKLKDVIKLSDVKFIDAPQNITQATCGSSDTKTIINKIQNDTNELSDDWETVAFTSVPVITPIEKPVLKSDADLNWRNKKQTNSPEQKTYQRNDRNFQRNDETKTGYQDKSRDVYQPRNGYQGDRLRTEYQPRNGYQGDRLRTEYQSRTGYQGDRPRNDYQPRTGYQNDRNWRDKESKPETSTYKPPHKRTGQNAPPVNQQPQNNDRNNRSWND
jgi:hypothetical protein